VIDDMLARARRMQAQAGELRALAAHLHELHPPAPSTGFDEWRAVAVTVAADGTPLAVEAQHGWHRRVHPDRLGEAVMDAYGQAAASAANGWAPALEGDELHDALTGAHRRAPADVGDELPAAEVRDLTALTEDILQAFAAGQGGDGGPRGHTGRAYAGAVTVTVAPGALLGCQVDASWAAAHSADDISEAFGQALADAGRTLAEAGAGEQDLLRRSDDLARQALSTLHALTGQEPQSREQS